MAPPTFIAVPSMLQWVRLQILFGYQLYINHPNASGTASVAGAAATVDADGAAADGAAAASNAPLGWPFGLQLPDHLQRVVDVLADVGH